MCKVNVNLGIFFNLAGYRTMINEITDDKRGKIIKPDMTQSNTERNAKKTEKIDEE